MNILMLSIKQHDTDLVHGYNEQCMKHLILNPKRKTLQIHDEKF